jgi:hypothetical protein
VVLVAASWMHQFDRGPVELAWVWCFDAINAAIPAKSGRALTPTSTQIGVPHGDAPQDRRRA